MKTKKRMPSGKTRETDDIKLLKSLAEEIKAEERTKDEALASLQGAGILTKKGNFTKNFKELKKVAVSSK